MGSGGVAIAALPTVICLKVPFSDSRGGGVWLRILNIKILRKDEFVLWLFGAFVVWFICMIKLNFLNLWIVVRTK